MLAGAVKRVFTSGPAGPAGATLAAALTDVTAGMKAVLMAPNLAAARAGLGLAIGSSVQAWNATLDALAALTTTAFGRSLLTQADAPTALVTLGATPAIRQVATPSAGGLSGGGALGADLSLAIAPSGVSNAMLAGVPAYTLKANLLASTANPADVGLSALIDAMFGNTRGAVLYRSASGWGLLAPGTAGQYLGTGGSGADPAWGTPQGAGNVSTANSPAAGPLAVFASGTSIQGLVLPLGQCRLAYSSTTAVVLKPFQGNQIWVGGAYRTIPAAGVSLANTGLAFGTLYYVYAYMNGSTLALEAVTTGHATDATYGHEIKSGDATRTLVGMVYMDGTSGTGTFADGPTKRYVASWFNRVDRALLGSAASLQTSSQTFVEVSAASRVYFLAWADDAIEFGGSGLTQADVTGNYCAVQLALGTTQVGTFTIGTSAIASAAVPASPLYAGPVPEGLSYATLQFNVNGGTGTFRVGIVGKVRS